MREQVSFCQFLFRGLKTKHHQSIYSSCHHQRNGTLFASSASAAAAAPPPTKSVVDSREEYERRVSAGELVRDEYQVKVLEHFTRLQSELTAYSASESALPDRPPANKFMRMFGFGQKEASLKRATAPRGIYLFGSVGCGKTMLMDMFYDCCDMERKRRIHFHSFMSGVHKRIHELKHAAAGSPGQPFDPVPMVATNVLEESSLLCVDEFQVTDIADAMILKRLFSQLFSRGLVVVSTSNRPPDDLYKKGLQRSQFVPFIDVLKNFCECVPLDSGMDYRRRTQEAAGQSYFVISESDADTELDKIFHKLAIRETDAIRSRVLSVFGRNVEVAKACGRIADFNFRDLCGKPLGPTDYLTVARVFHTIILRDIPVFTAANTGEARRFITLIDTLYDQKVRLVCSAQAKPDQLFRAEKTELTDTQRVLMDDLNISDREQSASIFTGQEEVFAFDRTLSRLAEMQSEVYWSHRERKI